MSCINEQIWIGSYRDACNESFLKKNGITHILCCAREFDGLPANLHTSDYTYYRVPIVEEPVGKNKFEAWFRKASAKLNTWVSEGHHVLVHCYAGISRSVSTVITYFILYKGYSFDQAYNEVKRGRKQMKPYTEFIPVLKSFERTRNKTRKNLKRK